MFRQQSTETVTLTRTQLQAILEIITQIGGQLSFRYVFGPNHHLIGELNIAWVSGISRSETWSESNLNKRSDKSVPFRDKNQSNNALEDSGQWERPNEDLLTSNGWLNDIERSGRNSSLLMLNDNRHLNLSMSPTSSESSKGEEVRADSVMTSVSSNEANFRRYSKLNDSEFDWNALLRKRAKALEYSRALTLQHEDKMKRKREEMIKRREEDEILEKRLEEQRSKMREEFQRERRLIEDKRIVAEKKREAVIAAIEKTPIIRKKFLVESSDDVQPMAAIKPQTRSQDTSAQTEVLGVQYCEIGTQTDVQLLLQLFNDLNIISKQKSKSLSKLEDVNRRTDGSLKPDKSKTTLTQRKSCFKSDNHLDKRGEKSAKRSVWMKNKPNLVVNRNAENEVTKSETQIKQNSTNESKIENNNPKIEMREKAFRRSSLNISHSNENLSNLRTERIKSSIEVKTGQKFLPQIGVRPHSRKKWYSQERFDPNFLS